MILLDEHGIICDWLMGAATIFGYRADEVVGRDMRCLFTPEDRERGIPASELDIAKRSGNEEDDRWMLRSDGVRFWASGIVQCLYQADGTVAGFCKVLRDRTDLRGQIEAMRNRAESTTLEHDRQALALGTLAHEIKNPLGVLANAVQLIDYAYPGDPKIDYAVQLLKRQTQYVSSLIDGLLDMVRVRTGKATLDIRVLDLRTLIDESIETVGAQLREKSQRAEVLMPTIDISIEGDGTRLKQVLVNLISNAAKFSERGATIWVKATVESKDAIVRVIDRGQGIDPALLPTVFDLLSQAPDDSQPPANAGLGLGLAIVKEYVELHGGGVQVRSEGLGRGSEFIVRLPIEQVRSEGATMHAAATRVRRPPPETSA